MAARMYMCKMSACAHAAMYSQFFSFVHSIMFINNIIVGQTHTTALHSRFANYAPNTRVLTSQGSWIEIENIIQAFLLPTRTQNLGLHLQEEGLVNLHTYKFEVRGISAG